MSVFELFLLWISPVLALNLNRKNLVPGLPSHGRFEAHARLCFRTTRFSFHAESSLFFCRPLLRRLLQVPFYFQWRRYCVGSTRDHIPSRHRSSVRKRLARGNNQEKVELSRPAVMGVPALFRWLSNKYPKIISPVIEEQPYEVDGEVIPVDTTGPNPNGEEIDNLYLDMNGIVHPCTHPEGKPPPENEQEMMLEIFKYTDRVVNMVRPRKLLLIAVGMMTPICSLFFI